MAQTDSPEPPARRFDVGLNITNTITTVLGTNSNNLTADPYLLSFRWGEFDRRRWRAGINFKLRHKNGTDVTGLTTDQKETGADLRLGYEWVKPMSRQLAFFWGLDGVFGYQGNEIESISVFGASSFLKNETWSFGGGPVLGLQWRVLPRVSLTTECSIYAVYKTGYEKVDAPPDVRNDPVSEFQLRPLLPSSLFVHFSF
ncbi:MAG TPA: hypothetical protein PKL15_07215 [Saprospiraceae bacterium]|nr:hypothetical protein [Saprospiraceae bacterium]